MLIPPTCHSFLNLLAPKKPRQHLNPTTRVLLIPEKAKQKNKYKVREEAKQKEGKKKTHIKMERSNPVESPRMSFIKGKAALPAFVLLAPPFPAAQS
jgi:hypothetical protein